MAVKFSESTIEIEASDLFCSEKASFVTPEAPSRLNSPYNPRKQFTSTPFVENQVKYMDQISVSCSHDNLLLDRRVILKMIESEKNAVRASNKYLYNSNVTENMRKILLRWMYEVSNYQWIIVYY